MCQGAESQRMEPASQKMGSLYSSIHLLFDWTFCILNSSCCATHGYSDALPWWEIMKVMGFYSIVLQRRCLQPHPSLHQLACEVALILKRFFWFSLMTLIRVLASRIWLHELNVIFFHPVMVSQGRALFPPQSHLPIYLSFIWGWCVLRKARWAKKKPNSVWSLSRGCPQTQE